MKLPKKDRKSDYSHGYDPNYNTGFKQIPKNLKQYVKKENECKYTKSLNDTNYVLVKYEQTEIPDSMLSNSSSRREIYSVLILLVFVFVTVVTISQIIVIHNQKSNSEFYQVKQMQDELRLMDESIDNMLREKGVMPVKLWHSLRSHIKNLKRFEHLFNEHISTDNNQDFFACNNQLINDTMFSRNKNVLLKVVTRNQRNKNDFICFNKTFANFFKKNRVSNYAIDSRKCQIIFGNVKNSLILNFSCTNCLKDLLRHFEINNIKPNYYILFEDDDRCENNYSYETDDNQKLYQLSSNLNASDTKTRLYLKYEMRRKSMKQNKNSKIQLCDIEPKNLGKYFYLILFFKNFNLKKN